MTDIILKPCPFCGSSASIEQYGDRSQSTIYRCENCSCTLETGEEWNHGAVWNRRDIPMTVSNPLNQIERSLDGPERIWAEVDDIGTKRWFSIKGMGDTEYVRADLYEAQLAGHRLTAQQSTDNLLRANAAESSVRELEEALKAAIEALEPFANSDMAPDIYDDDSCVAGSCDFTVGDLRRARETLLRIKP